ncbi:MAG TPA: hypothetical protein VHH73_13250, partial [Verrucomicrobiae bacterium]|nr:hypothetical protein [Verrucomicrobiae bacterium]
LNRLVGAGNNYVAVVHIDANGLGEAVMSVLRNPPGLAEGARMFYKGFCRAVARATEQAAQAALQRLLALHLSKFDDTPERKSRPVPFRPLVCAGEDFTFVIGAEHAVQFTRDYLAALEGASKDEFADLPDRPADFPDRLTACAGLVFCKRNYPFAQAYELAETLCGFSKKEVERKCSALTFMRLKSSRIASTDYEGVRVELFRGPDAELTMNPYRCGAAEAKSAVSISHLAALVELVQSEKMPRGALREMVAEAYQSRAAATRCFERIAQILGEREPEFLNALLSQLGTLTGQTANARAAKNVLWDHGDPPRTPLYDALELASLNSTPSNFGPHRAPSHESTLAHH